MREDFLHYLWKFKKFNSFDIKTSDGQDIIVHNVGQFLQLAGPDFFNAQISIGGQKWCGNVEIHVKSSDWYVHHHEKDQAYENVILHVVWEHDTEVYRKDNTVIPVLVLKNIISNGDLEKYKSLIIPKTWIFCENEISKIDSFVISQWKLRLFFERLERKSKAIYSLLEKTNNDWEAVLFCVLAKNFGLNTNGELFFEVAKSIPFSIIRKESFEIENLEALLFGMSGLLESQSEDNYHNILKSRFSYLTQKYQLVKANFGSPHFFKLHPDNFPTIRLAQLAKLYHSHQNLFSKLTTYKSAKEIYELFDVGTSNYWDNHYNFDKESPRKIKRISKAFKNLLLINTLVPLRFAYSKSQGLEIEEDLILMLNEIAPEKNIIIDKFKTFGVEVSNALETQSLLQLKNEYCNYGKCLDCAVGMELLKA